MSLRRDNSKLPWGAGGGGVYGRRRGGVGQPLLLGAIVVGIVAVAAFLLLQVCTSASCDEAYCATDRDVPAPEGFERVSKLFQYDSELGQPQDPISVQLPLTETVEETGNISFYRYTEETRAWEPVASAEVQPGGKHAIAILNEAPAVIAALRRLSPTGHVVAYLPQGTTLHPDAGGKVTVLHTLDFAPAADGGVAGDASAVPGDIKFEHYPVISASAATGGDAIVTSILSSDESRSNHVQRILAKVQESNLKGIDISYMDLGPDQRTSFALFVNELATALHRQQRKLTVTLPSPLWATDHVDEGAYDWTAIGAAADLVKIAPFRDQSHYRLDVPKILQHLTTVMDRGKLVFVVSPYATELSSDGTISIMTLVDAMAIATRLAIQGDRLTTDSNVDVVGTNIDRRENLTGMVWDNSTATVGFTYKFTTQRTVWLENFFSVGFKLEYVSEYRLGGVGVENASSEELLGNIWPALLPYIASGQPILMRPNEADLVPVWEVSGGQKEGGERAGRDGVLRWFTPAGPGTYTVKLLLSDGASQFESQISVNIQARTPAAGTTPGATQTPAR